MKKFLVVSMAALISGCGVAGSSSTATTPLAAAQDFEPFEGPVPKASCGAGSQPEPKLQGQVPLSDRQSGRSQAGYHCNLELKGQEQGQGTSWQDAWYEDCAYYDTVFMGGSTPVNPNFGVQVLDVSDSAHPVRTDALQTPAMLDPWESLKVNEKRGLLAADAGWNIAGPLFFDVYSVKDDCKHPKLMSSTPTIIAGHEGNWAPDGLTYYVGTGKGIVDVSNPELPEPIVTTDGNGSGHGLSLNAEGTRMYGVQASGAGSATGAFCSPNGLTIFDTSQIQARHPAPAMPVIGGVCWEDGSTAQHTILLHYGKKPFILFVDEGGKGAARLIDISDETAPFVVSKLKLEIHMPENDADFQADTQTNGTTFRYEAHYCGVDRQQDPTAAACGYFQSGIRVFDIRDPYHPREIAYYNPPAQVGQADRLKGSEHAHGFAASGAGATPPDLTADWCSSQIRFVKQPNGDAELWGTCQDNGFMVLKFTNGAWPFN